MFDTTNSPNRNMAIVKAVRHQYCSPVASIQSEATQHLRHLLESERGGLRPPIVSARCGDLALLLGTMSP